MLFNSTNAGAERLKRLAMPFKVSPERTVYFWGVIVVVGAPEVVDCAWSGIVVSPVDEFPPPSVSRLEMTARNTKTPVLHTR